MEMKFVHYFLSLQNVIIPRGESQSTARIKFEFNPASVDDNVFDHRWFPQLPLETVSQDEKLKIENCMLL